MEAFIDVFGEILQYSIPAILVMIIVKYLNDSQIKKQKLNEGFALKQEIIKTHLPLKLAAYERAILFLERINPESLLMRIGTQNKNAAQLREELVSEIKNEYEHNLVQQLYISHTGWQAVNYAKDEMINIINLSFQEVGKEVKGLELGKIILTKCSGLKELPTSKATFVLKSDILHLFSVDQKMR
ncbi:MAG: hypothetical protein KDE26_14760 [Bacteroidetes bacterium]|nr:hypothetical protein [Bacteroidota bacterium]MCB0844513.1 hypothetical protein [Bacteroidota bacterium]